MANMNKIDLIGALIMLVGLMGVYGAYKLISFVVLLMTGATANVAQSGDVAVPATINGTINETVVSISTGFTSFIAGDAVILGLIGLVVVVRLFWPLISQYLPKRKSMN